MKKTLKEMSLRERFDSRGFSPQAYAKAYGVDRATLYDVFAQRATGRKDSTNKSGDVRRIIAQLKKDKVWIGKLPWEV
jgi:ribosomal protein L29